MKSLFKLIKIVILFALIALVFFLLINKTFFYETFKSELMNGEGIPINRFIYMAKEDDNLNATFYTPLSITGLNNKKNEYLNSLTKCYDLYYYDQNNNITITKYDIIDNTYYRIVNISYVADNLCSEEYVLSDSWLYEYTNLSNYVTGDITSKAMSKLVTDIYNTKRVTDPKITNYQSSVSLKVIVKKDAETYNLEIKDFSASEIAIIKTYKSITSMAVYEMDNAALYLESLEKSPE